MHGKRQTADRFMLLNIYIYVEVYQTKDLLSRDERDNHSQYLHYLFATFFFPILPYSTTKLVNHIQKTRIDVRYLVVNTHFYASIDRCCFLHQPNACK